jgi:hypothetical protein
VLNLLEDVRPLLVIETTAHPNSSCVRDIFHWSNGKMRH